MSAATGVDDRARRIVDVAVAAPLLIVASPILFVLALAVMADDPGWPIYRTTRAGKGGRPFTLLKLRTMRRAAGPRITSGRDPRITRVGGLLRRSRLDELPQLINVLRGDMSLMGPRPEDPEFLRFYSREQMVILDVRPGLTGPSQLESVDEEEVLRPNDPEADYVERILPGKLERDLEYVRSRTLRTDLGYLLRTIALPLRPWRRRR